MAAVVTAAVVDEARPGPRWRRGHPRAAEERTAARAGGGDHPGGGPRGGPGRRPQRGGPPDGAGRPASGWPTTGTPWPPSSRSSGWTRAELDDRIARDAARVAELPAELPGLEEAPGRTRPTGRRRPAPSASGSTSGSPRPPPPAASGRSASAGLVERRRVLAERLREVERRLTGHADERRLAAERRTRLEADATAVERLTRRGRRGPDRARRRSGRAPGSHRRQLEAVRAGGARLEELRRQRSAHEHELAAVRGRLQKIELDLVEATVRRESVVETLRRELGCGPEEAMAAPAPELAEGVGPDDPDRSSSRRELAALGPVNPLALEELSELSERHRFLESQVEDVRAARRELHQVIRTLDEEIMHVFDAAFADVNEHFSNLVTSLFPGAPGGSR